MPFITKILFWYMDINGRLFINKRKKHTWTPMENFEVDNITYKADNHSLFFLRSSFKKWRMHHIDSHIWLENIFSKCLVNSLQQYYIHTLHNVPKFFIHDWQLKKQCELLVISCKIISIENWCWSQKSIFVTVMVAHLSDL